MVLVFSHEASITSPIIPWTTYLSQARRRCDTMHDVREGEREREREREKDRCAAYHWPVRTWQPWRHADRPPVSFVTSYWLLNGVVDGSGATNCGPSITGNGSGSGSGKWRNWSTRERTAERKTVRGIKIQRQGHARMGVSANDDKDAIEDIICSRRAVTKLAAIQHSGGLDLHRWMTYKRCLL